MHLAQYTKIGIVTKRFRTADFTDLYRLQLVLKHSGRLSVVILYLCTKMEDTLTEVC